MKRDSRSPALLIVKHGRLPHAELGQFARFGVVGLCATGVHAVTYGVAIAHWAIMPLSANVLGFTLAFAISFVGHRHWTFTAHTAGALRSLIRFLVTALLGLLLNTLITCLLVYRFALPAKTALLGILLVTPILTFVVSRNWVFSHAR